MAKFEREIAIEKAKNEERVKTMKDQACMF